jgi:propane monooxygenase reductase subunit
MDLHVPGTDLRRSFSMAGLPGTGQLEFLIKAYDGGAFAEALKAGIAPGSTIGFTGPYGSLRIGSTARDVLMVAGGSGMAPVLSLLRQLAAEGSTRRIQFFYGARTTEDLFHRDVIDELGSRLANFTYTEVLSHAPSWDGASGWVHEVAGAALASGEVSEPEIYTCGPPPMVDALISDFCAAHGVEEREIHYDKFTTAVEDD